MVGQNASKAAETKKNAGKQPPRPDHVFADSLCLFLGCSPDLTVDIEPCVVSAEDLLAILSLKPVLVLSEKLLEAMKKHPVKNRVFRL